MNILIFTTSEHTKEVFIEHLIPAGHTVYHTEFEWDVISQMLLHSIDLLVVDLDRLESDKALKIVEEVKNHSEERIKKGICLLYRHEIEKSQLTKFLRAGVAGYISAEVPEDQFAAMIEQNWERLRGVPVQRRYVRASLNADFPEERVEVWMPIEDRIEPLMALATDVSAGGIAIKLLEWPNEMELSIGEHISQMKFNLMDHTCIVDAVIVGVERPFVALRFTSLSEEDLNELSHFIFLRLSHFI